MDRSFDLVALLKQQPTKTHKVRPSQFVSVAGGVQKRLETNIRNRKSSRLSIFDRIRNIPKESPRAPTLSEVQVKAEHRKQQLEKWKEEKDKKKKAAAAQKKKPFVAGVSHRNTFGPPPPPRPIPSTSGRITRSQASKQRSEQAAKQPPQSFAPTNAAFKPPQFKNTKVPTLAPVTKKKTNNKYKPTFTFEPVLPKTTQNSRTTRSKAVLNKPGLQTSKPDSKVTLKPNEKTKGKVKNPSPKLRKTATRSLESAKSSDSVMTSSSAASLELSTPKSLKNLVPRSESSSEEKLRSPRSPPRQHVSLTPEQIIEEAKNISPCVTMSRGKDNARREMKKKLDEGLLDEDNSNMDSVNHFRRQLDSEISRLTGLCESWDKIFAQTVLPELIQELVLTAVGQARLLMSQKMQQFAGLVERCARPAPGSALVTAADLAGFWDMLFMQVENVDMRFKKLEELRARDWADEAPPPPAPAPARARAARRAKPSGGPSRLRDMIAAARKAKKEQESQSSDNSGSEKSEATPPERKTFEAGFFSVSSPLKKMGSSGPATPANKSSLLKSVLSSEARKASASKTSTSFAMLRASLMSKNVDIEGVSPLVQTPTMAPVNLFATPARSILKQTNPVSSKKPEKLKMVLFHEEASSPTSYTSCASEEVKEVEVLEKENKPATRRRSRLSRQNAEEHSSPVMTRSRRRSAQTPLLPADTNADTRTQHSDTRTQHSDTRTHNADTRARRKADTQETPKRSSRRRKSAAVV